MCGRKKTEPEHDLLIRPEFVLPWSWQQLCEELSLAAIRFTMQVAILCEMYYKSLAAVAGPTSEPCYELPMEVAALKELLDKSSFPEGMLTVTNEKKCCFVSLILKHSSFSKNDVINKYIYIYLRLTPDSRAPAKNVGPFLRLS